ncbi:MAG: type II toxin-antitoxin system RelE/ParE family toxin [Planctomycetota bacterium]|nr:type II toxin-antitoxin system RelE/ParE family toxin [Planctomycetaceae bacterium]MDQ3332766.1 type II toxin-antitoxin system RelE/ParE family toxin [Planctomycetota bacterium]
MIADERNSDRSTNKPLVLLHGEIRTPPLSIEARKEAGHLLRLLQQGESLGMPCSRPMPLIGPRCHELRINGTNVTWRIFYRIDDDAILVAGVEVKKTQKSPKPLLDTVRERLRRYDRTAEISDEEV